jgi:glycosyltransferase involved in cell wall biosynthesis
LITSTIGREAQLARLLLSLKAQTCTDFELIVVDQSADGRISGLVEDVAIGQAVRYFRSDRGLSKGRNVGLQHARGEIVGFPDDDCWYANDVIARVHRHFETAESSVLLGRTIDGDGIESVSTHRGESGEVDRTNVFISGNSNTLFARTSIAREVGGFDEALGVGAATPFQSGEETDFVLRCMGRGYRPYFVHDFVVHHDRSEIPPAAQIARAKTYSRGYGRLLRRHGYGMNDLGVRVGRALLRGAWCLATGDRSGTWQRLHWIRGAVAGFIAPQLKSDGIMSDRQVERASAAQSPTTTR